MQHSKSRKQCKALNMIPNTRRGNFFIIRQRCTCSRASSLGELRSCANMGTTPMSITTLVCIDVPEAMFVRAQAASNYKFAKDGKRYLYVTPNKYNLHFVRRMGNNELEAEVEEILRNKIMNKTRDNTSLDHFLNRRTLFRYQD